MLFGPESTGKTTLARQLAGHFKTEWVPEYMRIYLEDKFPGQVPVITPEDLLHIAEGQLKLEKEKEQKARDFLFLDTDLLELIVYSEVYYGQTDEKLKNLAEANPHDFYLLMDVDIPWEPDPLRDKPHERMEMFHAFEQMLRKKNLPYIVINGTGEKRLQKTIQFLEAMKKYHHLFSPQDLAGFHKRNISPGEIHRQWEALKKGKLYVDIQKPATPGDGIIRLLEDSQKRYREIFKREQNQHKIVKFVPASGAATRMFKDCHLLKNYFQKNPGTSVDEALEALQLETCKEKRNRFPLLAFYEEWIHAMHKMFPDTDNLSPDEQFKKSIESLLSPEGLNYGNIPKALVLFHKYETEKRTALEEHMVEARQVSGGKLHLTVVPEKEKLFRETIQKVKDKYPGVEIDFSYQDPSTDTVMTDEKGNLVRDENGQIVFRPGGHGSLLQNLLQAGGDMLFIKNIDNVQKDAYKTDTFLWYEILGGMLLDKIKKLHAVLTKLETEKPGKNEIKSILEEIREVYPLRLIEGFDTLPASHQREYLMYKLNRPVRVAGMVKNTGAPGGGPFWIKDRDGNLSLQIVEKAQIDLENPEQKNHFERSTHFNPVFMAVYLKDYKNDFFDLNAFKNDDLAFVSEKIQNGKPVKIYEHPGLWNGGMHHWISFFVEIPESVFSPVKTFYDLMEKPHV